VVFKVGQWYRVEPRISWLWRPPHTGVPEIVSRQSHPLRSAVSQAFANPMQRPAACVGYLTQLDLGFCQNKGGGSGCARTGGHLRSRIPNVRCGSKLKHIPVHNLKRYHPAHCKGQFVPLVVSESQALKSIFVTLLWVLSALQCAMAVADTAPQAVRDQLVALYGAQAPLAIRQTGSTTSFSRGEGALVRLFKSPDRFRNEITYSSGQEVRTLVGPLAWQQSKPANPALRSAIVLQAARVALPWNVLARWSETHDRGTEPDDSGNTLQLIELELEPNLKLVIHVDRASGRIVRSRGVMEVGTRSMEFATRYSDFRSQSGRVYAAREQQFAAGQHTGYSVIEHIEFLDALPDSAFAPWLQVQAPAHTSPRILLTKVDHVLSPRIPETR